MNAKWLILLILAVSFFIITCLYRVIRTAHSKITSVNGDVFDWGVVDEDASIQHDFIIKNEGNSDLVIEDIKTGCGCTKAEISKNKVAPNETATLRVEYQARRTPDREYITIWVKNNDRNTPVEEFALTGFVKLAVTCHPKSLSFDLSTEKDIPSQTLHFRTNTGTFELLKCSAPDSITLEWDKTAEEYICRVKPKHEYAGSISQKIAAEFRVGDKIKVISVPVYILH
ncbi:MAG TPA: DUF1573 domain-containing protein [Sedimentisphaerales bacterium]|nr:DUF1573 domain-containing protein [Sedimentisphaerales bacterium]